VKIFGYEISRKREIEQEIESFAPKPQDDGAVVVAAGGAYGTYVDLDGTVRTEAELISKYRDMAQHPEVDDAINEIVNETVALDEPSPISINLDDLDKIDGVSPKVKDSIRDEFNTILKLLEFNSKGYEIYRNWYVDGRVFYHTIIDPANLKAGIKELRPIDPRKIRKVREVASKRLKGVPGGQTPADTIINQTANEYYIYNNRGFAQQTQQAMTTSQTSTGMRIAKDAIVSVVSGLLDSTGTMVLSYLHKAIKPLNQLRMLEDAVVIYRLARAPERRVWYIDVGNLPRAKAEQYMRELMAKHKNKLVYDSSSGNIRDDRKFMTMLEDYWLTRREGGRGTEVDTLPGGQNLGQMDDVLYFQKRLYKSLNVPTSRLEEGSPFDMGQPTAISNDEVKFNKFVVRLRGKFSTLFLKCLERQLILKGIMTYDDWVLIKQSIRFDFAKDTYFTELKDAEVLTSRLQMLQLIDPTGPYIGKYYSAEWVRKNILRQTDEQMTAMDEQIADEKNNPQYGDPLVQGVQDAQGDTDPYTAGQEEPEEEPAAALAAKPAAKPTPKPAPKKKESSTDEDNVMAMAQDTYDKLTTKKKLTPSEKDKLKAAVAVLSKNETDK
jgi:hypothetical protein